MTVEIMYNVLMLNYSLTFIFLRFLKTVYFEWVLLYLNQFNYMYKL